MKKTLLLLCFLAGIGILHAQKKDFPDVIDSLRKTGSGAKPDQLIRMSILDFTTPQGINQDFGGKLTLFVTDALQEVDHFQVLENAGNTSEINSLFANLTNNSQINEAKQLNPQVIISGEIVDIGEVAPKMLSLKPKKMSLTVLLKITNAETKDIMFSQKLSVTENEAPVGRGYVNYPSWVMMIEEVPVRLKICQDMTLEIVRSIISNKQVSNIPTANANQGLPPANSQTTVILYTANFEKLNALATILKSAPNFKSMEKHFDQNIATFTIDHSGSSDDLADDLGKKINGQYEIVGFKRGKILVLTKN